MRLSRRERLNRRIEKLREKEQALFEARDRFWAQEFLCEVYRFVERMSFGDLRRLSGPDADEATDVFKTILDLTTKADGKTKSRWLQALFFVYETIEADGGDVQDIFGAFGGIAGCAGRYAVPKSRPSSRRRDWV